MENTDNASGRVAKQVLARRLPEAATYLFAYATNAAGKVTATTVTDPLGHKRRIVFHASGYPASETLAYGDALQQTTTYTRAAATGRLTAEVDALGRKTTLGYDGNGNVTAVTRLAGTANAVTTRLTCTPEDSQPAAYTDPLGHTWTFSYQAGRLTDIARPPPCGHEKTHLDYDAAHRPIRITDPTGQPTQLGYDGADLQAVTDPLNRSTYRMHDAVGRLIAVRTALGQLTQFAYNDTTRTLVTTDPDGQSTTQAFDANGNLIQVTDARGGVTGFVYDARNRLTQRTDPLGRSETWTYDDLGHVLTHTDRRGQTTTLTYDALDRLAHITYPSGGTADLSYDAGHRLLEIVDSSAGTLAYDYDDLDRLTGEQSPNGTVAYTYDAAGRRDSLTVTGQPLIAYAYDTANRLTTLTQGSAVVQFEYDAASQRTALRLPNGVRVDSVYDAAHQVTGLTYRTAGGALLGAVTYDYDAGGRVLRRGGSLAPARLPAATRVDATYDQGNRMTSFNGAALSYDAHGNLTADGTRSFTWNARNQLQSMTYAGGTATFVYDPVGRRLRKTVNGTLTRFLYDGLNPVREVIGTTAVARLGGLGLDEWFSRTEGGVTRYPLVDALGSTLALTDENGAIKTRYAYAPFGGVGVTGPEAASSNPYQFTGRENDGTGLYFYRARYYDPNLQRFIAEDPIGLAGGINPYAYVRNNPLNLVDPLGLESATYNIPSAPFIFPPGSPGYNATLGALNALSDAMHDALDLIYIAKPTDSAGGSEHTSGARPSTESKHQEGDARRKRDRGGEKGDENRDYPRRPPQNWKGPWPPKKKPSCE